jgi:hypothetical protein
MRAFASQSRATPRSVCRAGLVLGPRALVSFAVLNERKLDQASSCTGARPSAGGALPWPWDGPPTPSLALPCHERALGSCTAQVPALLALVYVALWLKDKMTWKAVK